MVADFRALSGSVSEGDSACADAQISLQQRLEDAGAGRKRRDGETGDDDLTLEEKLDNVQNEIAGLGAVFDDGHIVASTYYSELRRLQLLKQHLMQQYSQANLISGKKPKKQKDMEQLCPNLSSTGEVTNGADTLRFTTSFICPKSCIWDEYVLYYPDNLLEF